MQNVIDKIEDKLVVSCQVTDEEGHKDMENPIQGPALMAALAAAGEAGGAGGVRVDGPRDIYAVNKMIDIPIIGIYKKDLPDYPVRITPTFETAKEIVERGADIVALDATKRERPGGVSAGELIDKVRKELDTPVMADISTAEEAYKAAEAGADLVATTLSGYTPYGPPAEKEPNINLVEEINNNTNTPVVMEGHIGTPQQAGEVIKRGAHAVVVGSAIVNVRRITESFVEGIEAVK